MLSRRELIAGGAVTRLARGDAAAAQRGGDPARDSADALAGIQQALADIRSQHTIATPVFSQLRDRQRQFYRINQRFPECIDVGIRAWESMQEWHIRHLRPLTINRTGDGRWQMDFIMSVIVLKHELPENEIGQPYDR